MSTEINQHIIEQPCRCFRHVKHLDTFRFLHWPKDTFGIKTSKNSYNRVDGKLNRFMREVRNDPAHGRDFLDETVVLVDLDIKWSVRL